MAVICEPYAPVTESEKLRCLPWSLVAGPLNAFLGYWSFAGSFFVIFLSQLKMPAALIGALIATFPFCGLLAPFFAHIAAREGRKRVFLAGYGIRNFVMAGLVFLPLVIAHLGPPAGVAFLVCIIVVFAILRALAETAYYPWLQEFVPNALRGKYSGLSAVLTMTASITAVFIAGLVIGPGAQLPRFLSLIGAGCVFGFLGVLAMVPVPGGRPLPAEDHATHGANLVDALRDANLRAFLLGLGAVTLGGLFLTSFLPIFVKQQLGLRSGTVVMLDTAVLIGAGLASPAWGWAADRFGSRPIQISAIALMLLAPVGWLLMPRDAAHPLIWCIALYGAYGILSAGFTVGTGRMLFNSVVPPEKSTAYTAIYYAWIGITGGLGPLLAGAILSLKLSFHAGPLRLDAYDTLFLISIALLTAGWLIFQRVTPDGDYTTRDVLRLMMAKALMREPRSTSLE